jgi:hypothetical protein
MHRSEPPPLTYTEPAHRTYTVAALYLLPAFVIWLFSKGFLEPKMQMIWRKAEFEKLPSVMEWLLAVSDFFKTQFVWVQAAILLAFVVSELSFKSWPRYRRTAVMTVAILLNTLVLISLCISSMLVSIAAPMAIHKAEKKALPPAPVEEAQSTPENQLPQ